MSLQAIKVRGNILQPFLAVSYINFILTLVVLVMSATIFARPSGVQLEFSPFRQAGESSSKAAEIIVTGENVLYIDSRVVTLNELRRFLAQGDYRGGVLTVKVDRRASMGRVADILELCRGIAGASVNVSTIL